MGSFTSVVVGTDGSASSLRAVDRAASLAKDAGATLHLVSAYAPLSQRDRERAAEELGARGYLGDGSDVAEGVLRVAADRAASAGADRVERHALPGSPVDVLIEAARDNAADLLVVGNRGLNSLSGRILGSVPQDVAHKATCDVLIVHTTD